MHPRNNYCAELYLYLQDRTNVHGCFLDLDSHYRKFCNTMFHNIFEQAPLLHDIVQAQLMHVIDTTILSVTLYILRTCNFIVMCSAFEALQILFYVRLYR